MPYGIDMVGARDVWDANRDGIVDLGAPTGANRKICIIDSGFLATHKDLQGINVTGYNGNLPWNQDGDGHGSHVAGTIAAMNNNLGVVGVTPGTVQLYIVRVFGDDGLWAYSSDLIDAANRCASVGSNIISMSLGSSSSSSTQQAKFDELNAQGILSIAAAGNSGTTAFSYPASYPSVISVAAINSSKVVASFSQRNSQVDIAAPGVGIRSTIPGGYASWGGTSMATPHVSAVAALIWSARPSATNEQVRTALINTAEDLGVVGRDDIYGYGLVNAKRAVDYLVISSPATASPSASPSKSPTTSAPTASQSELPMTSTPTASPSKAPMSSAPTPTNKPTTRTPTTKKPTSCLVIGERLKSHGLTCACGTNYCWGHDTTGLCCSGYCRITSRGVSVCREAPP